jgi:hypothetical protein
LAASNISHATLIALVQETAAEIERLRKTVISAQTLQEWVGEKVSDAEYAHEEIGTALEKTTSWEELTSSLRCGRLASYRDEFYQALNPRDTAHG